MEQPKRHSASSTGFRLSIRIVVFGALGALGLLAVGKFGWEASRSRDAYARTVDRTRALAAGFQMHLAKPVQPTELAAAVLLLAGGAGTTPQT